MVAILEQLLKDAEAANDIGKIKILLDLCDAIYYSGRTQFYNKIGYTLNDLPSDLIYDKFRKVFTPNVKPGDNLSEDATADEEKVKPEFTLFTLKKYRRDNFKDLTNKISGYEKLFISEKLDGMACEMEFTDGILTRALTRFKKESKAIVITNKAKYFATYPDKSLCPKKLVIIGEILLVGDKYKKYNYENRRNGCAGIINNKYKYNGDESKLKDLTFVVYELAHVEGIDYPTNHEEKFKFLKHLGFETPKYEVVENKNITADYLEKKILDFRAINNTNKDLYYDIDGIVISPLEYTYENVDEPDMKFSFKFMYDELLKSIVLNIVVKVGRSGKITPVIKIKPIKFIDTTVKSITGSNFSIVKEKNILVGSIISISKRGNVIPHIEGNADNSNLPENSIAIIPDKCPLCQKPTSWAEIEEGIGRDLVCTNPDCLAKKLNIAYFFRKLGLENFGPKLFEILDLSSIESAYRLTVEELKELPGFNKRADTFIKDIRSILKDVQEDVYLSACSINGVSDSIALSILSHISFTKLFNIDNQYDDNITYDEWYKMMPEIKGIGEAKFKSIYEYLKLVKEFTTYLIENESLTFAPREALIDNPKIKNKNFALTGKGTLSHDDYKSKIEANGGKVLNNISSHTDYLVSSENRDGDKITKAKHLGIAILTYQTLDKWLGL